MSHKVSPPISYAAALFSTEAKSKVSYAAMAKGMSQISLSDKKGVQEQKAEYAALRLIRDVHEDDVHALARVNEGSFVSGSKDGSVKKWSAEAELLSVPCSLEEIDYEKWITALEALDDGSILAGTRDGYVSHYAEDSTYLGDICSPMEQIKSSVSKVRNWERINCIAKHHLARDRSILFVGRPTLFTVHDMHTGRQVSSVKTHKSDWVYAIAPLSERSIGVVTGTELEVWLATGDRFSTWEKTASLVSDKVGSSEHKVQRPFISHITPLLDREDLWALSLFNSGKRDGETSLKIIDIENGQVVFERPGHIGRTWMIENIARDIFASCGDEGTVKIWDLRHKNEIATVQDNTTKKARVSALLMMQQHRLISASCPDVMEKGDEKARFCIRDMRKYTHGLK